LPSGTASPSGRRSPVAPCSGRCSRRGQGQLGCHVCVIDSTNRRAKRRRLGRKTLSGSVAPQSTAPRKKSRRRKAGADVAPSTPTQSNSVAGTPLKIPYGNKDVAMKLGARYGSAGWSAPPGVDLSAFGERGWPKRGCRFGIAAFNGETRARMRCLRQLRIWPHIP